MAQQGAQPLLSSIFAVAGLALYCVVIAPGYHASNFVVSPQGPTFHTSGPSGFIYDLDTSVGIRKSLHESFTGDHSRSIEVKVRGFLAKLLIDFEFDPTPFSMACPLGG